MVPLPVIDDNVFSCDRQIICSYVLYDPVYSLFGEEVARMSNINTVYPRYSQALHQDWSAHHLQCFRTNNAGTKSIGHLGQAVPYNAKCYRRETFSAVLDSTQCMNVSALR